MASISSSVRSLNWFRSRVNGTEGIELWAAIFSKLEAKMRKREVACEDEE